MAGIGKLAIGLFLFLIMAIVLAGTLSMAKADQTTDPICQGGTTCNSTVKMTEMAGTQSVNLLLPGVAVLGGVFLFGVLMFLRKSSR